MFTSPPQPSTVITLCVLIGVLGHLATGDSVWAALAASAIMALGA
jgi:hypothetical protein